MRIIINGVGIAGPTLAYWLRRAGHDVLLVESAPRLRSGGYVIDFWGVGYTIAEKMGLIPRIMEQGYLVREVRFVDRRGRTCGGFSTAMFHRFLDGRFTSLRRSDLAAAIHGALGAEVETRFGDSVARIEEVPGAVRVGFDRGDSLLADLVIGADGLHSRVRRLAFGAENNAVEVPLGYHVAAFEIAGYRPRDELIYISHGVPGRQISRFSMRDDKTLILLVFRDEYLTNPGPLTTDAERKAALARAFAGVGWEWPAIEAAMADVDGLYFDQVSQVRMYRWTQGRVALVGDAAACVSLLAGEGTGLAMAEAYVLAGELSRCVGDPAAALAQYEERMWSFLREKQAAAGFASSFAPRTALGITFRNAVTRLFRLPLLGGFVLGRTLRDDIALPDYEF